MFRVWRRWKVPVANSLLLDMSAAAVDLRLRRLRDLSAVLPSSRLLVDMSAAAVSERLRECAEISALALELVAAGASRPTGA
jgi:hypothetical protein